MVGLRSLSSSFAAVTARGDGSVPLGFGRSSESGLPPATWETVEAVRAHTGLPVVFKRILAVEDARRAAEAGADGIVVSNHRGRAVGRCGARQTLELLAVERRDATDLVGCASKDTAREILTTGGNRRSEVNVQNRGGSGGVWPPLTCL